jgi:hypothetical protein
MAESLRLLVSDGLTVSEADLAFILIMAMKTERVSQ